VKSILSRRPTPALAIACVALFLSLGGVSYGVATGFIDSREIKDNTIRSRDVRNNTLRTFDIRNNEIRGFDVRNSSVQGRDVAFDTLTGDDISEDDLEKVPSAATADTATSAGTVGGMSVRKVFVKQATGTAAVEIFRGDGFLIEAGCQGGNPVLQLDGIAGAPATNATVSGTGAGPGPAAPIFATDATLVPGDDVNLLDANNEGAGTAIVSTTGGAVATIVYGAESAPAFTGESVCAARAMVTLG
jgi:hypothetical protein